MTTYNHTYDLNMFIYFYVEAVCTLDMLLFRMMINKDNYVSPKANHPPQSLQILKPWFPESTQASHHPGMIPQEGLMRLLDYPASSHCCHQIQDQSQPQHGAEVVQERVCWLDLNGKWEKTRLFLTCKCQLIYMQLYIYIYLLYHIFLFTWFF